jgi:mannose-1-phosphate guanylyltransferase
MRHAIILAGGSGERFWPVSREDRPKQFLPLAGPASLLRATYLRVQGVIPPGRIWVVTHERHLRRVRDELPEVPAAQILGEPVGRNTAPALARGAIAVARRDPGAVTLVVPADSWVPRAAPYRKALRAALRQAEISSNLVLVGVLPDRAETGYGYIEPGDRVGKGPACAVRRFIEKPSRARAERFLAGGRHLWNSGIFAWKAGVFLDAVETHLPSLHRAFRPLSAGRVTRSALAAAYRRAPGISVDYGILESAGNVAVVPAAFPWDDLGSWRALERLGAQGTFRRGPVVALDSPGLVAWAEEGTVAVVGLSDIVAVHTRDATLVMAKDRAQDVRAVVAEVAKLKRKRQLKEG